ncbi:hypothetical protein ILYODFUR_006952 [Ilyodon furcidens]|uniref:Uncharacterized protein n=1 Tax=Ilyodon furcidens TaxID=33524 RepID=A0ABV0TSL8_9TELE
MEWKPRRRHQLIFSLDHPSLKEVVEPFWSPFSLVSCSREFGNSSLDTSRHPASQEPPENHPSTCLSTLQR